MIQDMTTEAFVYKWTYKPTLDWYVGSHTGTEDDGYICSSQIVKNLYNIDPTDWERTIVARGTTSEMFELESTILQVADAKRDTRSFNRHNNKLPAGWNKGIAMSDKTKEIQRQQRLGKSTAKKGRKYPGTRPQHAIEANREKMMGNTWNKGKPWSPARRKAYEDRFCIKLT